MFLPAVIAFLTLLTIAGFSGADRRVVAASQKIRGRSRLLDRFFQLISFQPVVATVLFLAPAMGLLWRGQLPDLLPLSVAPSLALGLTFTGKYLFRRPRPLGHITYIGKGDAAFPSAHAAGSFATAGVLATAWPTLAGLWFALATAIAVSRLYLQLHFLSDIAAGAALGLLTAAFVTHSNLLFFLQLAFAQIYHLIF